MQMQRTPKGFADRSFDTPKETVGTNAEVSSAGRWPSGDVDASYHEVR